MFWKIWNDFKSSYIRLVLAPCISTFPSLSSTLQRRHNHGRHLKINMHDVTRYCLPLTWRLRKIRKHENNKSLLFKIIMIVWWWVCLSFAFLLMKYVQGLSNCWALDNIYSKYWQIWNLMQRLMLGSHCWVIDLR